MPPLLEVLPPYQAARAPLTVDVVLPLPLDQTYTYRVPPGFRADAQVGCRVLVPFGARRLTGVIVGEGAPAEDADFDFDLKDVLDVLDDEPALTSEMLRLTRWMASYYVCGWGEAIKMALPTGTNVKTRRRLRRLETEAGAWADHGLGYRILQDLNARTETTLSALRKRLGEPVPLALVRRMARDGVVALDTELSDPSVTAKYETHLRLAPAFQHPSAARDARTGLRGHKQRAVMEAMAGFLTEGVRAPRQADVKARADAGYSTVQSLVEKGILESVEKEVMRSPLDDLPDPGDPPDYTLHDGQQQALDALTEAVERETFEAFLLHGVTGSGKTEVYIAALKAVRALGKTGIILVPEIALTPQTVQRFRAHFGDQIAVLHSQMSLGERYDAWRGLREGRFPIAIGPRSAILAPLDDLGLIVVDEEHEHSYKQFDPAPRYHARDVAVMRASMNGAVCVLGSATPSLESVMNARRGKYTRLDMPERVPVPGHAAAPLPEIRVVDLTLERKKHRLDGVLSKPLLDGMEARLARNEQVILLQNRRGYAPVIECEDCGWSPLCRDCSVTMTYHKAKRHLRCHYCGRTARRPRTCPSCQSDALSLIGTGTQRVEEELDACFPGAAILRMDRDTTSRKNAHHEILDRFRQHEADILLGTQMVAKGLDFGRVTLVGVVDADVGLLLPDFRSDERTFQLLTQVAGRAGRADLRGEVILQTRNPEHAALRCAQAYDYEGFVEAALEERRMFSYPPFGRVATVEFRGSDAGRTERLAQQWTNTLKKHAGGIELLGPEPAFIERVKRYYRFRTILKTPRANGALQTALRRTEAAYGSIPNGYYCSIDVDALGLL